MDTGVNNSAKRWISIQVPPICERIIGFSVPYKNKVLVISYEGSHLLSLGPKIVVNHDYTTKEYDNYNPDLGIANYAGIAYQIIGLHYGQPIIKNQQGETLELDHANLKLSVKNGKKVLFHYQFQDFSGDWAATTFSPDGNWIILGCAYDFDVRVFRRNKIILGIP